MTYLIGIDGGGTSTKAVVTTLKGEVIARAVSGPSNILKVGEEGLKKAILEILMTLEEQHQIDPDKIEHWVLGLAGAGRENEKERAGNAVKSLGISKEITIESDAYIGILGAFMGNPGIIFISGTGSICFGLDEKGSLFRSGGWGYLLGDEGSGYYLGSQGVLAALKDFDGRGRKTLIRTELEKELSLDSIDQIIPLIYGSNSTTTENMARLAPVVFRCLSAGDEIAGEIVDSACREIAVMIEAVAIKMNQAGAPLEVAYAGSVFKQKEVLVPRIIAELNDHHKGVNFQKPSLEPALGAIVLALRKRGGASKEILSNLRAPE